MDRPLQRLFLQAIVILPVIVYRNIYISYVNLNGIILYVF